MLGSGLSWVDDAQWGVCQTQLVKKNNETTKQQ